jgi:hypothetical protein
MLVNHSEILDCGKIEDSTWGQGTSEGAREIAKVKRFKTCRVTENKTFNFQNLIKLWSLSFNVLGNKHWIAFKRDAVRYPAVDVIELFQWPFTKLF